MEKTGNAVPIAAVVSRSAAHQDVAPWARHCERESVKVSLDNLMSFPCVAQSVRANKLSIHGWYFEIATGGLSHYDAAAGGFAAL